MDDEKLKDIIKKFAKNDRGEWLSISDTLLNMAEMFNKDIKEENKCMVKEEVCEEVKRNSNNCHASVCIHFDKKNKQQEYQVIAEDFEGVERIGWVVIEQPWYTSEDHWNYWLYYNRYGKGICGGASDLGIDKVLIKGETIRPYTQIEEIKHNLKSGLTVILEKEYYIFPEEAPDDNILAIIKTESDIPYKLWG